MIPDSSCAGSAPLLPQVMEALVQTCLQVSCLFNYYHLTWDRVFDTDLKMPPVPLPLCLHTIILIGDTATGSFCNWWKKMLAHDS